MWRLMFPGFELPPTLSCWQNVSWFSPPLCFSLVFVKVVGGMVFFLSAQLSARTLGNVTQSI